jgi:hypothetical protein
MTLKDLLRIAFNAGREDEDGFESWWDSEGNERHEEFLTEGEPTTYDDPPGGMMGDAPSDS